MENGIKNKEEKEKKSSSIKKKFNKVLNLIRLSRKYFIDFRLLSNSFPLVNILKLNKNNKLF